MTPKLNAEAKRLLARCRERKLKIATAESCTGGLIAATLTEIAGSSDVVERGFVVYSNAAKAELLGVPALRIERKGSVSEEVARAMARGALENSHADLAVAVTGIAGPGGGSSKKPVGLVHLVARRRDGKTLHRRKIFSGNRRAVRLATVAEALALLRALT